jgi:alanine racemase
MLTDEASRRSAGACLSIDLAALATNYGILAQRVAPATAAAVVKADAYGLGARPVARVLEAAGCQHFLVAHLGEGLDLKPTLAADSKVYVLNGLQPGGEAVCAAAGVIPVLNSLEQAWLWRDLTLELGRPLSAAIQIDSGMSRLGLPPEDVETLAADADFFQRVPMALVMSHLACSDEPGHPANVDQARRFATLADRLPAAPRSLANSGGVFLGADFHGDLARLGVCLYGAAPNGDRPNPMRPVVRLDARVIQVREIAAGQGVGYGLTHSRPSASRIATIALGYADGWPRDLSNVGAAYYQGVRLPIAGRVSMDSITLDVSALVEMGLTLRLGDLVELLGPYQSLEDVARDAGTIPYEILTNLGHRYHRTYLEGPRP